MCASGNNRTYPHDYRVICGAEPAPLVVGGQAVNIWALSFLSRESPDLRSHDYGSSDLDILAEAKVLEYLKTLSGWAYVPQSLRNWGDLRVALVHGLADDGRQLLVEVLHRVHGLDTQDLKAAEYVVERGVTYRVLDPIVMLKAKAANVRDFDQTERQDRLHLNLLARCVPLYLQEVHRIAAEAGDPAAEKQALRTVSRAFSTLQSPRVAQTLRAEGIEPAALIPAELKESKLARIRTAYAFQMKQVEAPRLRRGPGLSP